MIEVLLAGADQEPVFANLLELYAHDFSEFYPVELNEDGRYGYSQLPLYWREPGRFPFLIRVNGTLAGFVLVVRNGAIWDIAEFFIVRRYRRTGIGTTVAKEIWHRFPGAWEVRVMEANTRAMPFWSRAMADFVVTERAEGGWRVFSFSAVQLDT